MTNKATLRTLVLSTSWIVAVLAVLYIGLAIYGGKTAKAEETNTLVCTPASTNNAYTMPPPTAWRLTDSSEVGDTSWSGHYVGQAIITDGNDQYIGYYNAERRMTIGYRTLGATAWELYNIPDAEAVVGWDSHNYIALAVDKNGNLHVSGNMHGGAIKYWQTTTPRQLTSIQKIQTLVNASDETSVTYPQFMKDKEGNLIFSYRNGASGSGRTYFNTFNPSDNTWAPLLTTDLFDGLAFSPDRSAYFNLSPTPNAEGYYEMTWMWRDTGDVVTNSRLSYARSMDLQNWETISGAAVTLPITYNTPGVVIDDIPQSGGLFNNQEKLGVDANGDTTVTYSKYDELGSNQIYVARPNANGEWESTKITNWTGSWLFWGNGTLAARVVVGGTVVLPNGDLRLSFSCGGATPGSGTIVLSNDSLAALAQIPTYNTDIFPNAVWENTVTTPVSTSRRVTSLVGADKRYILKWQSQGVNQDGAFASYPAAQPVKVFSLSTYSVATTPSNLSIAYSDENTTANLSWDAPLDDGGHPITDYVVEYTTDQGMTWTTFAHDPSADTSAVITGLDPENMYYFRISAVNALGVSGALTDLIVEEPSIPGGIGNPDAETPSGSLPLPPNTGLLLPTTIHPAALMALGISSSILLLSAVRRHIAVS